MCAAFPLVRFLRACAVVGAALLVPSCGADDPLVTGPDGTALCAVTPADAGTNAATGGEAGHAHEAADGHVSETDMADMEMSDMAGTDMADGHTHDHAAGGPEWVAEIEMFDYGYSCTLPGLPAGSVVEVVFTNNGTQLHEAVIGDAADQVEAERQMAAMDMTEMGGGHHHHGAPSVSLAPGETGSVVVELTSGETIIGCHVPGHYDLGMHTSYRIG